MGLWAWLGYREEWATITKGGAKRYRFRSLGATVHFGFKGHDPKPQIFRAEWAGVVPAAANKFDFQARNAGHPHWQFDAVDSLLNPRDIDRAAEFAQILKAEQEESGLQDFTPDAVEGTEIADVISSRSVACMHFASAAPWWRSSGFKGHAHAPETPRQLRDWLKGTLSYVRQELDRV
jgi:hypothetical protein